MARSPDKRAQTRRRGRGTKNNLRAWQLQQAGVGVGRGPGPLKNAGIGPPGGVEDVRITGSKNVLLRTLVAASSAKWRVLAGPALYRSGAPERIRTSHPRSGDQPSFRPVRSAVR